MLKEKKQDERYEVTLGYVPDKSDFDQNEYEPRTKSKTYEIDAAARKILTALAVPESNRKKSLKIISTR